jgi:RNA recognition motif-containing protein
VYNHNHHNHSSSINNHQPLLNGPIPPPPPPPPLPQSGAPDNQNQNQTSSKKGLVKRMAAGKTWVDPTMEEWPENDFRIFCGNLDKSTTDTQLFDHFKKYASIAKSKVVKDNMGGSKGFGFVSFLQPLDSAKAIREMDQTWLGSRPIRIKRSDWKDRNLNQVIKKNKRENKKKKRFGL